jgi:CDP-glycerol glycerophosphotransferase (TagB/SpsB family)
MTCNNHLQWSARMLCLTKLVKWIVYLILFIGAKLIPREKNIWVFGSWYGHRYADNSRYLFEHVLRQEPGIRAIWLTRSRAVLKMVRQSGREAYMVNSVMGYWLCCRAGVIVVTCGLDDVNRVASSGAMIVQLWHGSPLKKIGLDDNITTTNIDGPIKARLRATLSKVFNFVSDQYDLVISPSPHVSNHFKSAFGVTSDQVIVTGYPRADLILSSHRPAIDLLDSIACRFGRPRIVLYAPTHRGEGKFKFDLFEQFNIDNLKQCLDSNQAVLIIKMHYTHRKLKSVILGRETSRIFWATEDDISDINLLLPYVDVLITDYSSIFFDFLLLDRPILFAPFDKDRYLLREREFYEDYDQITPGPKCYTFSELLEHLNSTLQGEDQFKLQRREICKKYNSYIDTQNCTRIVSCIKTRQQKNGSVQ